MITIALLLAIPLCLRWIVSWRMRQVQATVQKSEGEFQTLKAELRRILEENENVRQMERQQRAKRSRLVDNIHVMRGELEEMRQSAKTRKIAA